MWFELPSNTSVAAKDNTQVTCLVCKRFFSDLEQQLKCFAAESPEERLKCKMFG